MGEISLLRGKPDSYYFLHYFNLYPLPVNGYPVFQNRNCWCSVNTSAIKLLKG
jgi:hypothetical protein